jgi:hypothetical protein
MAQRQIEERIDRSLFAIPAVLLCSEPTPANCHRRLVVEYLQTKWGDLNCKHL